MPSSPDSTPVAGLLLTGGASRRMGFDKARIELDGTTLAARTAKLARQVAAPVLELGPGHSGLETVAESAPGSGPLAALADGVAALRARGFTGPSLLLATDLPRLDTHTLTALASWPGQHSIVPLLDDRPQPLCARWSAAELDAVPALVAAGERSFRALLARPGVVFTDALAAAALQDVDTPADLERVTGSGYRSR